MWFISQSYPVKTQYLELNKKTASCTSIGVIVLSTVNFLNNGISFKLLNRAIFEIMAKFDLIETKDKVHLFIPMPNFRREKRTGCKR